MLAVCMAMAGASFAQARATDALRSWNDGPARQAILEFVRVATDKADPKFIAPEDRIATFDQDGTLWVEQPLYAQAMFALARVGELAPKHPEWANQMPFKAILAKDREAMAKFSEQDWAKVIGVTHSGMTPEAFQELVNQWLATATDPRFKRTYTGAIYQPMLEVMDYLRANGFRVYIVTGGGQEFVRAYSQRVYAVPVEQVIGSAGKVKYGYDAAGKPMLTKLPEVLLIDDKGGKPEGINLIIGKGPCAAFGNSDGDQQMLEWTGAGGGARLMMLVHHDDAAREYAYDTASKVGTFSKALMAEAKQRGWTVISMKDDWKTIFPGGR